MSFVRAGDRKRTPPRRRSTRDSLRDSLDSNYSNLVDRFNDKNNTLNMSMASSRQSVLSDNTDIEEPRRKSWWKNLGEHSRDVIEILESQESNDIHDIVEEYADVEILSPEVYRDLSDTSQVDLPKQPITSQQNVLAEPDLSLEVNTSPESLLSNEHKRIRPIFPSDLLNISNLNKTKDATVDAGNKHRSLFGNREARKTMFTDISLYQDLSDTSQVDLPKQSITPRQNAEPLNISNLNKNKDATVDAGNKQRALFGNRGVRKNMFTDISLYQDLSDTSQVDRPKQPSTSRQNAEPDLNLEVNTSPASLLNNERKRIRPIFPSELLNISNLNKTKDATIDAENKQRALFGNRVVRKNMFTDFTASESEEEISELHPDSEATRNIMITEMHHDSESTRHMVNTEMHHDSESTRNMVDTEMHPDFQSTRNIIDTEMHLNSESTRNMVNTEMHHDSKSTRNMVGTEMHPDSESTRHMVNTEMHHDSESTRNMVDTEMHPDFESTRNIMDTEMHLDSESTRNMVNTEMHHDSESTRNMVGTEMHPDSEMTRNMMDTEIHPDSESTTNIVATKLHSDSESIRNSMATDIEHESESTTNIVATEIEHESESTTNIVATKIHPDSESIRNSMATEIEHESESTTNIVATDIHHDSESIRNSMATEIEHESESTTNIVATDIHHDSESIRNSMATEIDHESESPSNIEIHLESESKRNSMSTRKQPELELIRNNFATEIEPELESTRNSMGLVKDATVDTGNIQRALFGNREARKNMFTDISLYQDLSDTSQVDLPKQPITPRQNAEPDLNLEVNMSPARLLINERKRIRPIFPSDLLNISNLNKSKDATVDAGNKQRALFGNRKARKNMFRDTSLYQDLSDTSQVDLPKQPMTPRQNAEPDLNLEVNISPASLLTNERKRSRPIFPSDLLNISNLNKTKDATVDAGHKQRALFGNRGVRKNMFTDFTASESEEEISELHADSESTRNVVDTEMHPDSESTRISMATEMHPDSESTRISMATEMHPDSESTRNSMATEMHPDSESTRNSMTTEIEHESESTRNSMATEILPESESTRNSVQRELKSMRNDVAEIQPELESTRNSMGLVEGSVDSSGARSEWDSHRTLRKTMRKTFGKDFTPRKSLRTLIMQKEARRQTAMTVNSTEIHPYTNVVHSPPQGTPEKTQTTLEQYLLIIEQNNLQIKQRVQEKVKTYMNAPARITDKEDIYTRKPTMSRTDFKKPAKPKPRKNFDLLGPLPEGFLEDVNYKPPKRYKPPNASWVTKRLYTFLEKKLEPKYFYKARVRAEKIVEALFDFSKMIKKLDVAPREDIEKLKVELSKMNVVQTHFEFYNFIREYMPTEFRVKVIPDISNQLPLPPEGVFADIASRHR